MCVEEDDDDCFASALLAEQGMFCGPRMTVQLRAHAHHPAQQFMAVATTGSLRMTHINVHNTLML